MRAERLPWLGLGVVALSVAAGLTLGRFEYDDPTVHLLLSVAALVGASAAARSKVSGFSCSVRAP